MSDGIMREDVSSISFCIESVAPGNGRTRFEQDEGGFYKGVPISAIGVSTRNNSYYDVNSLVEHLNNPSTPVNMMLRDRSLHGECGHPKIIGLSHEEAIARIRDIDENNTSHLFKSIYIGKPLESGGKLVLADIKPIRDKGRYVKESFDDPEQNTAFSIRTLTCNTVKGNISYRKMLQFITADFVNTPGYAQATKRYAHIGTEDFGSSTVDDFICIEPARQADGYYVVDGISTESFTDGELNEFFGSKNVTTSRRTVTLAHTSNMGNRFFQPIVGSTKADAFLRGY